MLRSTLHPCAPSSPLTACMGMVTKLLASPCASAPLIRMSSQEAKKDRDGNVIRKQPKLWIQRKKELKRQLNLLRPTREIVVPDVSTPKTLSSMLGVRTVDILKWMIQVGEKPTSSEQPISREMAEMIAKEFNFSPVSRAKGQHEISRRNLEEEDLSKCPSRPPVVTVIGHIDHGKTTLLDRLRKTQVAKGEAGGITQHIGAFIVELESKDKITFMDTPGHAAFSSLRERGVRTTDIALLVIAADDGIQEQTIEALKAAQMAKVQLLVVITKIDKVTDGDEPANTMPIRAGLLQHGVILEEFGGNVQCVEISAQTGRGILDLEQAIVLQAGMMDLRAPIDGDAEGTIIEARTVKGRGIVSTSLVRVGTFKHGNIVIAGTSYGRLKGLTDFQGKSIQSAGPSMPIEFVGLSSVPPPGEDVFVVKDEEVAQQIANHRRQARANKEASDELAYAKRKAAQVGIEEDQTKLVTAILKTDVVGSIEGVKKALAELPEDEYKLHIIKSTVGPVVEADIDLATLSKSVIIAFGVKPLPTLSDYVLKSGVQIHESRIVYTIVDKMRELLTSKLTPRTVIDVFGVAEVREVFEIEKTKHDTLSVAGCMVTEGLMKRGSIVRVLRGGEVVAEGKLDTLRSFKQNVNDVRKGNECGISVTGVDTFEKGDTLQAINRRLVPRRLGDQYNPKNNLKNK